MQLIETAINEKGNSYIRKSTLLESRELSGYTNTDIFLINEFPPKMQASSAEITDNYNLKPGEIKFFKCDISPTKLIYDAIKKTNQNPPPLEKLFDHSTATIDFITVLKGPVVLIVNDEKIELATGDCVVQRGALHTWHNYTDDIVTIMAVMIGAAAPPQYKPIAFPKPDSGLPG